MDPKEAKVEAWIGTIERNPKCFSTIGDLIINNVPKSLWRTLAKRCPPVKEALKTKDDQDELLEILKDPDIFNKITINELDKKIVREYKVRKAIFLCAGGGRLVENCQVASYNLLINDEAGAGKDYVTGKTLEILPKPIYIKKTRISPTVFTYWHNSNSDSDWTWDGKVFYTEDIAESVLNSEVFKVMSSSGSQATVVVRQRAVDIDIIGKPVMITTTATATPSPELTRRFEIINLDESIDQTKEIMKRHCEYAIKGITPEYNPKISEAMKLLVRVKVKIPYANILHKLFPAQSIMMRTKFPRFLDFIKASASLHQFQRKTDKEGYIIAEGKDYEIAAEVMNALSSNKYLISLTRNQRRIVDFLEKMSELNQDYSESASRIREQMNNFISLTAMMTNLSLMSSYGILKVHIEDGINGREIEKYAINENLKQQKGILFPSFSSLISTKPIKPIKPIKPVSAIKEK